MTGSLTVSEFVPILVALQYYAVKRTSYLRKFKAKLDRTLSVYLFKEQSCVVCVVVRKSRPS